MAFLDECEEYFGTKDLYDILGVSKTASQSEVKKGYHKASLKFHPDRVNDNEKEVATKKFQTLGKVYCVLSDKDNRSVYDETGEVPDDDDSAIPPDRDWSAYWRILFPQVTLKDIQEYEKKYKGSDEELEDLKKAYLKHKGSMEEILSEVVCAEIEDEERFAKIIKNWIKIKDVPDFPAFSKENKKAKESRKRKAKQEAEEAEEMKQELGLNVDDSLKALIQKRQQSRGAQMSSFFDELEAKYAQPKKAKASSNSATKTKKKGKK